MREEFSFLLLLGVVLVPLTTACSEKDSKPKTSPKPPASSPINAEFNSNLANGHFTQTINSGEMNQKSRSEGLFRDRGDVTNLTHTLTQKKRSQTEQIWLARKDMYLLLEQSERHWIRDSANTNAFDPDQVKERFNPTIFKEISEALAKEATVQEKNGNYGIGFNGTDSNLWSVVNPLVINATNTPGLQNMRVARLAKSAQVQNLKITCLVDPTTESVESMTFRAQHAAGGKHNFTWILTYDQLGQYADLVIPTGIQRNVVGAKEIKRA